MENLIKNMMAADTLDAYEIASQACIDHLSGATEDQRQEIKEMMLRKTEILLAKAYETRQKATDLIAEFKKKDVTLEIDGQKYPLNEWVTMKEYCRRFGLKNTMIINNWITRKIIPSENVLNISQLNNLKLIKAVPYKS